MFQVSVTLDATPALIAAVNRLADALQNTTSAVAVQETPAETEAPVRRKKPAPKVVEAPEEQQGAPFDEAGTVGQPDAPAPEETVVDEPQTSTVSETTVRELVVAKSREGKKPEVRELIHSFDVTGWTELVPNPERLAEFYAKLKTL